MASYFLERRKGRVLPETWNLLRPISWLTSGMPGTSHPPALPPSHYPSRMGLLVSEGTGSVCLAPGHNGCSSGWLSPRDPQVSLPHLLQVFVKMSPHQWNFPWSPYWKSPRCPLPSLYHLLAYAFTFTSLLLLSPPHSTLHKHVEFFLICSLLCSQCSEHCLACRLTDTKPAVRWLYSRALWLGVSEMSFHWEYLCDSENEIKLRAEGLPPAWGFFQPRSLYLFGSWPSLFPARPPTGIPAPVLQPSLLPCPRKCRPASFQGRRTWPYDYPFSFDLSFSQPAKTT